MDWGRDPVESLGIFPITRRLSAMTSALLETDCHGAVGVVW